MIRLIHRYRRSIVFLCLGFILGKLIWFLGDEPALMVLGMMCGMPFGSGITLVYLHKKGIIK